MSNDIYTVATVFETKGQEEAEKALRDNEAAVKAYEKAQQTLNTRMKVSIDRSNAKAKTLGQLDSATKKAENEIKRLSVSVEQGAITGGQYQGRLNQISATLKRLGLEGAQSKVLSYGRATREATTAVMRHEAALKRKKTTQDRATDSTRKLTQATRQGTNASQAIRNQFLGAANAIAVLDGPLGGVASRFSAFGVLAGRAGFALAGLGVATTAFSFIAQRAIRDFADWEVQIATLENRLNTFGNQVNLTSQEIVRLSEDIGLSTLADEREVLRAANQLLTFRNISTDVFDDVLTAAQDLAASGFGTIESETVKLAKALEDPRQSLTSLSRAGVVFTRAQREMIISLVDTGREAEAMALILQNVERQVGGAGVAQANNTLAGSFDTIGQAVRTASRELGEFVADALGVRQLLSEMAEGAANYIESTQDTTPERSIRAAREELERLNAQLDNVVSRSDRGMLSTAFLGRGQRFREDVEAQIEVQEEIIRGLQEQLRVEQDLEALSSSSGVLDRRFQNLEDIQAQIDLQRELIGLTQEEARVRTAMAQAGLGGDVWANINEEIETYRQRLIAVGTDISEVNRLVREHRQNLQDARTVADQWRSAIEEAARSRAINQLNDSTSEGNDLLRAQVRILREARDAGNEDLTVTEARRLAQIEVHMAMLDQEQSFLLMREASVGLTEVELQRLSVVLATRDALNEQSILLGQLGEFTKTPSSGGGGGGVDPNEEYQRELESLQEYLNRRREEMMIANGLESLVVQEQYEERFNTLQNALERELVTRQEYDEMYVQLARSREDRISEIERESQQYRRDAWSSALGDLSSLMSSESDKMFRIGQAAAIAQATIDGYSAAIAAWNKGMQVGGPPVAAAFTAMSLARTGAMISQIGGRQSGGGSAGGRTAEAPPSSGGPGPQKVLIQGLDPDALYTGDQLQKLFEAFYDENDNRGKVFVVSR